MSDEGLPMYDPSPAIYWNRFSTNFSDYEIRLAEVLLLVVPSDIWACMVAGGSDRVR